MSDPTAGERCTCGTWDDRLKAHAPWCGVFTPAEPDAGDVEALGGVDLRDAIAGDLHERFAPDWQAHWDDLDLDERKETTYWDMATALTDPDGIVTASLDAVRRKAGDERAEQIAQAIEAARDVSQAPNYRAGFDVAARIARESRT